MPSAPGPSSAVPRGSQHSDAARSKVSAGPAAAVRKGQRLHPKRRTRETTECSSGLPGWRLAGLEHLANFAVDDALLIAAAGVARDDAAPEAHRRCIAQVLADLPATGEAAEDELHRR